MKGYYINLECRRDRRRHIENNILTLDFFKDLERFEGIKNQELGIGCGESWIKIIEKCIEIEDQDYFLLIEDDISIDNDDIFNKFLQDFEEIKEKEWDVITFTPHWANCNDILLDNTFPKIYDKFYKINKSFTMTGLIIKKSFLPIFVKNLKDGLKLLKETKYDNLYKNDIYWFSLQEEHTLLCYQENFCSQLDILITNCVKNNTYGHFQKWNTHGRTAPNKLENLLLRYINNPHSDYNCFYLAREYEIEKQYALAKSYYLKCCDNTIYDELAYESLIRIGYCLGGMDGRDEKCVSAYEHAISTLPDRPEAYYILSLYYSWRNNFKKSYLYSELALHNCDIKNYRLYFETQYKGVNYSLFQKAYTGSKIGKMIESIEIYNDLLCKDIDDNLRIIVNNNLNYVIKSSYKYHYCYHSYTNEKMKQLKYKFTGYEKIKRNYSEIYQDIFVLTLHNGKNHGNYLEIGAFDPFLGNNTYLLEKMFNWSGISIEIDRKCVRDFNSVRKNKCLCEDARKTDYCKLLEKYETIDYLQLDCDPPNITYEILLKIPFDRVKFGVITYKHDYYNDKTKLYRKKSRDYLKKMGYKMLAGNISPNNTNMPYEDWWIHPDLIKEEIYSLFIEKEKDYIFGEDYILQK
tara:strand:+ start:2742 stop:4640 length:1899 start_codon:yes stop_codon:yes gene_type:complete